MARLVIEILCSDEPYYREADVAWVLLQFATKLTSWTSLIPGRTLPITDHRGREIGTAKLED
jgi:hypothetical protein